MLGTAGCDVGAWGRLGLEELLGRVNRLSRARYVKSWGNPHSELSKPHKSLSGPAWSSVAAVRAASCGRTLPWDLQPPDSLTAPSSCGMYTSSAHQAAYLLLCIVAPPSRPHQAGSLWGPGSYAGVTTQVAAWNVC